MSAPGMFLSNPFNFSFTFNTDGCSISDSSTSSAWPLYVQINELSPHLRKKHTMLARIYVDKKKPVTNDFLKPFVDQVYDLFTTGVSWESSSGMVLSKFVALICSVDSPARSSILQMKQYNGEYGCTWCYAAGKSFSRRHVYPVGKNPIKLRTDQEIRDAMIKSHETNTEIKGVKGPSALMLLPLFNLAKGMVVETMHCCYLGIIKKHSQLLFTKDYDIISDEKLKKKQKSSCTLLHREA
ncbi:uncharacterized protein LOC123274104 [Cotesia glomerata]|uniref:uncharacterized protein LOC123274104 n=1 Tax=Cotesia glomerata TaxID=32391 RepID=UPI001D02101F|nr:uncharacterized protein LOC123274104 [Cotesia glomerata]